MASVPHFDLPFRRVGSSFRTVEQDSYGDIINCVQAILRTPAGFRDDAPPFGSSGLLFANQPIGKELIEDMIVSQEPRASVVVQEAADRFDALIDKISIEVSAAGGEE